MRQAIQTKWLSPTNSRPSRIIAKCDAGKITVSWDHGLNVEENHTEAAFALAKKLGWDGQWVGGATPGSGYAFVLFREDDTFTIKPWPRPERPYCPPSNLTGVEPMQQQKTSQTSQTRYDGVYRQKGAALPSLAAPGMYVVELPDGTLLQNAMGQNRRFSSLSRAVIWIDRA